MDEEYFIEKLFPSDKSGILIFCDNIKGTTIRTFNLDANNILKVLISTMVEIANKETDNIDIDRLKPILIGIIQLMDNKKGD